MTQNILEEVKNTYYDYVSKIAPGVVKIANDLRNENFEEAFQQIGDFAEGMQWLVEIEEKMQLNQYHINSRIYEVNEFILEINEQLNEQDYFAVADIFEYEIQPVFSSSTEWVFEKEE